MEMIFEIFKSITFLSKLLLFIVIISFFLRALGTHER